VIEAPGVRPGRKLRAAKFAEALLESAVGGAGVRITRGNWAAGAGVAALEGDVADLEAYDATFALSEELIFPKRGHAFCLKRGAESPAGFVERYAGKPLADRLERCSGNNRRAGGEAVIGKTVARVADLNPLLKVHAEPFRGAIGIAWKSECHRGNFAAVSGNGEGNGADIRSVCGANEMHGGGALAIDPAAVCGVERPDTIEFQASIGPDPRFVYGDGV